MDKQIIITIIVIGFCVIFGYMNLMKPKMREYMPQSELSLTDIDIEALQNLSSMYDSSTQTLNVANITATGNLAVTGNATVGGTTKTTGATYSKYYVINSHNSDTNDLTEINNLIKTGGGGVAAGVIYSSGMSNLGIKSGAHLYLTTYNNSKMIDAYGQTVDYYTNTKSGKDGTKV